VFGFLMVGVSARTPPSPLRVSVTFDANGGNPTTQTATVNTLETYGALFEQIQTPTKDDPYWSWEFMGWFTTPIGFGVQIHANDIVTMDSPRVLYAWWDSGPRPHRIIHFDGNGGDPDMQTASVRGNDPGVTMEHLFEQVTEPSRWGHRFAGWFTERQGGEQVFADDVVAWLMLFAQWERIAPLRPHPFTDIPDDAWYADAVQFMYEYKLMQGMSATHFAPAQTLTRAQMVTILWRMAGAPTTTFQPVFSDVPSNAPAWYRNAVMWASETRVVRGFNGRFDPYGEITREQFATMLYRYAIYRIDDTYVPSFFSLEQFSDYDQISRWATDAMRWAVYNGLIIGNGGRLMPDGTATRAECAMILMRFAG